MSKLKTLLLLLVILQKSSSRPLIGEQAARMKSLDRNMKLLNLTDIHFTDPGLFVKVGVIINQYNMTSDIEEQMQKKLSEVEEILMNGPKAERDKVLQLVVNNIPAPP